MKRLRSVGAERHKKMWTLPEMRTVVPSRNSEHMRIQHALERFHSPRLQMALIAFLTGIIGFFSSVTLLHAGFGAMWIRYPLAIGLAYCAFLFFLWCWLRLRGKNTSDGFDLPSNLPSGSSSTDCVPTIDSLTAGGGNFGGGGASGSFDDGSTMAADYAVSGGDASSGFSDAAGGLDFGEFAVILVVIIAIAGAAWAALGIVTEAPSFLAEIILDAALAGGLYRRLTGVEGDHWLQTAVRRTVWRFAIVALLFSIAGIAMHIYSPEARSIGQVFVHHD
jgi:hypothetical protein